MSDRKTDIFKALAESPVRIRILPRPAEPLIPGSSVHGEDAGFIIAEARARHRVDIIPNEPPEAALEETRTKAGKAAAVVKKPAVMVAAPEKAPDLRRRLKDLKDEIRTLTKKKR